MILGTPLLAHASVLFSAEETPGPVERTREQVGESAEEAVQQLSELSLLLIRIGAIIGGAILLILLIRFLIGRWERRRAGEGPAIERTEREQRVHTIGVVLRHTTTAVIGTIALLLVLGRVGVNLGPLIAGAGVAGVALGFGAQNLVRDHLSGFFILLEDQFSVGDIIECLGVSGVVEKITLRTTVLRDLDGRQHIIPNGLMEVATNNTAEWSRYLMDLPVPYEADVDHAIQVFCDVLDEMRREPQYAGVILTPMEVLGVNAYGESEVLVRVYFDTTPGKHFSTGREYRRRLLYAYREAGLAVPYPHRELILRGFSDTEPEGRLPDPETRPTEDGSSSRDDGPPSGGRAP